MSGAPPYPKIYNRYVRREDDTVDLSIVKRAEFGLVDKWMVTEKIDGANTRVSLEDIHEHSDNDHEDCSPASSECYRKIWDVRFGGRTNRAQPVDFIEEYLKATFKLDAMKQLWQGRRNCDRCGGTGREDSGQPKILSQLAEPFPYACDCVEPYPIVLYGEVYGARIQKGGEYRKDGDISFRLFDVLVGETWLSWGSVVAIANALNIKTVPVLLVPDYASPASAALSGMPVVPDIIDFVREGFKSLVAEEEGTPRLAEGIVARTDPYLFDGHGRRMVWKLKTRDF